MCFIYRVLFPTSQKTHLACIIKNTRLMLFIETDIQNKTIAQRYNSDRKIAKSDYLLRHVRLSVRMEQLDSHITDSD
jgi:hypothetical protein